MHTLTSRIRSIWCCSQNGAFNHRTKMLRHLQGWTVTYLPLAMRDPVLKFKPGFLEDTLPSLPGQVPPSSELTCYLTHPFISAISKPLVFSLPKSQHFGKLFSWQGWKWWMYETQRFTCDREWEIMSSTTESRLDPDHKDWHQKTQLRVFKVWDTDMWTHFAFSTCP